MKEGKAGFEDEDEDEDDPPSREASEDRGRTEHNTDEHGRGIEGVSHHLNPHPDPLPSDGRGRFAFGSFPQGSAPHPSATLG